MPEGHTLYRLAREQTRLFVGRPVHVTSHQGRFAAGAALLDGRVLEGVVSHGKHLFAAFGPDTLHVHLGLYGSYATGTGVAPGSARGAPDAVGGSGPRRDRCVDRPPRPDRVRGAGRPGGRGHPGPAPGPAPPAPR